MCIRDSGMAYEALNNASRLKRNFIIILNDNNMSIAENVGGMSEYLNGLRTNEAYTNFKTGVEQSLSRIPGGSHLANQLKKTKSGIKPVSYTHLRSASGGGHDGGSCAGRSF